MAVKAPVQDKGGVVKDILLVSQVPINVNVAMSDVKNLLTLFTATRWGLFFVLSRTKINRSYVNLSDTLS